MRELFPLPTFPHIPRTFPCQGDSKDTVILPLLSGCPGPKVVSAN